MTVIKPAEKRASVMLFHEETDGPNCWVVAIRSVIGEREWDLDERFLTPGAALDAGCKWAIQHGLVPTVSGLTFDLIKPGEVQP